VKGTGPLDFVMAQQASSRVKAPLHRLLYDMARRNVSHSKRGHSIDSNRLAGVIAGNFNVFKSEQITKAPNTAISLVVDRSMSMSFSGTTKSGFQYANDYKIKVVNEACYAIAKGVESLPDVKTEVLYYPFDNNVSIAKSFKDKTITSKPFFQVDAGGGTPTGRAMQIALERLALQSETKKMMFILTDGEASGDEVTLIQRTINEAQALGIQVVAFGICTRRVTGFEDVGFIELDDISHLHISIKDAIKQKMIN